MVINMKSKSMEQLIDRMKEKIVQADAIVIGAGSGLSTAAGLTYSGERFQKYFDEFIKRYGMRDMYSAGFYPFESQEEKWAYWSRHIYYNRFEPSAMRLYQDLYSLMKDKNYFVLTTNVDHQFWKSGFSNERIFATQGDYGLFQCKKACHKKLYDNEPKVTEMIKHQKNCRIPDFLIPKCPVCGGDMEVNLRSDGFFIEDDEWHEASARYQNFLDNNKTNKILFLELGVGMNTPGIIKYPFWQMTNQLEHATYICLNKGEAWIPTEIIEKSISIDGDLDEIVSKWRGGTNS